VKLREIATAHYGKALKRENRDESGSFDVFGSAGIVGRHSEPVVKHPTLVVGRKGSVGEVIWAPNGGWIIDTAYFLELKDTKAIDLRYLYYALKRANLDRRTITTSIPGLNRDDLYDSYLPLPPIKEQKRIATILDKADAIRRKRQQAIHLADEFLRAVFLDMFGDPQANPGDWEFKSVSECLAQEIILHVQDGNHGNDHPKVSEFVKEGIPFITANVIRRGKVLFDRCYYLGGEWLHRLRIGFAKPRDVLISHKGSLGFTAVLDDEFENYILSPQTTYYRVDETRLIPEYLKAYFDSTYFQRLFEKEGIQSTRAYLGITRQKDLPIMLPTMQKQREYVAVSNNFRDMMEKIVASSGDLPRCFDSLSQKAFSGKL
jgi:type I restriction enzyme S subunit